MPKGKLYLIPNLIAENAVETIPVYILKIIQETDIYIVENIKPARRFIKLMVKEKDIDACTFIELNKHQQYTFDELQLSEMLQGKNIGLISDAGTPCIADPGNNVVQLAQEMNITVVPLVGPNSILMALMASGFNGQLFTFNGYLPIEENERKKKILLMENFAKNGHTQIFMDTPYRNKKLFDELLKICKYDTLLCVACSISSSEEFIKTLLIADWKKRQPEINKKPTIFLLGK